jgi:gamma-glutamyltranspeptidase
MSPLVLLDHDRPVAVLGCAGGPVIPTALVEILENYYLHKMTLREAMAFPRFHPGDDTLELDATLSEGLAKQLAAAGYKTSRELFVTTPMALARRSPTEAWEAASEPLDDGYAVTVQHGGAKTR